MYPVVPYNARVMSEKSVSVGGYHFSKNVGLTHTPSRARVLKLFGSREPLAQTFIIFQLT